MSNLSQFFGSGGASNFIKAQVLIAAGGGGNGGTAPFAQGGGGGAGGLFYDFVEIEPGSTCPVVVGAGGAGGTMKRPYPNNNGSPSTFTTPTGTIFVMGGGGGGQGDPGRYGGTGRDGGSDGGSGGGNYGPYPYVSLNSPLGAPSAGNSVYSSTSNDTNTFKHTNSFYGSPGANYKIPPSAQSTNSVGATNGGGASTSVIFSDTTLPNPSYVPTGNGMYLDIIAGSSESYCEGGSSYAIVPVPVRSPAATANTGNGGSGRSNDIVPNTATNYYGQAGGSGVVIVRYPTQFGAAPSYPGATDLTPTTSPFGFRTYKFTSPGSITLP